MASLVFEKLTSAEAVTITLPDVAYACDEIYKPLVSGVKMIARTESVDHVQPPLKLRKDRVIGVLCRVCCPRVLEPRKKEFFEKSYRFLVDYYGKDNVHGGFVCLKKHDYRSNRTTKQCKIATYTDSLYYVSVLISCYTEEKGINGKEFTQKWRLLKVQKAFDEFVFNEFGVHYNVDDPSIDEINLLKGTNKELEEKIKEYEKRIADLEKEANKPSLNLENYNNLKKENSSLKQNLGVLEAKYATLKDKLNSNVPTSEEEEKATYYLLRRAIGYLIAMDNQKYTYINAFVDTFKEDKPHKKRIVNVISSVIAEKNRKKA